METLSMSVSHGKPGDGRHNIDLEYRARLDNVDKSRSDLNETLVFRGPVQVYFELFGAALAAYNARQVEKGHPERQIDDYVKHVLRSKQEHFDYECVVQLGNRETNPATDAGCRDLSRMVYARFAERWEKEFPNLRIWEAVVHNDEETPHLHIRYVPFSTGNKRGLETKNSLRGAMRQMGFGDTREINYRMMTLLEECAREHGIERLEVGCTRERLDVRQFKAAMRNGEDLDYRTHPKIVQLVLEQQETIAKQAEIIEDYEKALEEAAQAKMTSVREVRESARGALDRNADGRSWLQGRLDAFREIVAEVQERWHDFVLNPVTSKAREIGRRLSAISGETPERHQLTREEIAADALARSRASLPRPKPYEPPSFADDMKKAEEMNRRAYERRANRSSSRGKGRSK